MTSKDLSMTFPSVPLHCLTLCLGFTIAAVLIFRFNTSSNIAYMFGVTGRGDLSRKLC